MKKLPPKVTGIGGIFFFSKNPDKTKQWYAQHLGLATNPWGSTFEFRNAHRPEEINYLQWSPFEQDSDYFSPSKKAFMINSEYKTSRAWWKSLKKKASMYWTKSQVTIMENLSIYSMMREIKSSFGNL